METLRIDYQSPGGEWFCLSGDEAGDQGVILSSNIDDFYDVGIDTIWNATAFGKGARYGGVKYPERRMSFSVDISDYNGEPWEINDSRWGKSWHPDRAGKLWFSTDSSRRWINVSLASAMKFTPQSDPFQSQGESVVMSIIAGDPFYYSDPLTDSWTSPTATLATQAGSPTGYQRNGGTITVRNESHLTVYPQWRVQAPGIITLPDYSFGDDRENRALTDATRLITLAETISSEHLLVDTDRSAWGGQFQTALDTPYYARMGGVQFCYGLPPYLPPTDVYVEASKAPAGVTIQVVIPQPWSRPWGLE